MKKNKSQVSNVVAFRSIIIIIDRFPSSFLSDRKRRKKKCHRSFVVRTRARSLLFPLSFDVYRIVWSSLVNANRHLIICLSIDVHVIWRQFEEKRKNITMDQLYKQKILQLSSAWSYWPLSIPSTRTCSKKWSDIDRDRLISNRTI